MCKRNNQILIFLSDKELQSLDKKVKQTGLTRSSYIRSVIRGIVPREMPTERFFGTVENMRGLIISVEQLAQLIYQTHGKYDNELATIKEKLESSRLKIMEKLLVPEKYIART